MFKIVAAIGLLSLSMATFSPAVAKQETLVDLLRAGNREAVLAAITSPDIEIDAQEPDGSTVLLWATHKVDHELVRALLKAGAKANVANRFGASPLTEAVKIIDVELVRMLLDAGADANTANQDNQTALMLASSLGSLEIAKQLIERGARVNEVETFRGQTALMWAAAEHHPDVVELLLARRADVKLRAKHDDWPRQMTSEPRAQFRHTGGFTALLYATRSGCYRCAVAIVKAGADVNQPNPDGITPLINALDNKSFDIAMFLLDQGANPSAWDMNGRTPLYVAVDMNSFKARSSFTEFDGTPVPREPSNVKAMDVVNRLLAMGVDPNHQLTRMRPNGYGRGRFADYMMRGGTGPLMVATLSHDGEAIKTLLANGAEVDLPNTFQITPLMAAAGMSGSSRGGVGSSIGASAGGEGSVQQDLQARAIATIDLLLDAGADINARVIDSRTRSAKLTAYIQGRDHEGKTALFAAAEAAMDRVVKHLIDRGADPMVRDAVGKSALDYARSGPPAGPSGAPPPPPAVAASRAATVALLESLVSRPDSSRTKTSGKAANVTAERLLNATNEPSQWMTYNGDYNEQRYSRLDRINKDNVAKLGLAWYADFPTNLPVEGSPLYVDGAIYQPLPWSKVAAYDARTGAQLWLYDPKVPGEWNIHICCGVDTRGIAAWNGKIIVGTLDGRLIAIDAATGKQAWSVNTIDKQWPYSITGAPRVADGKVFIGNAGADLGVRGYVSAYDVETGKFLWRFHTVPGDPKLGFENEAMRKAAQTWDGEWWTLGGGGTVWDAIVYDPKTDLLYIGVGNGSPWNQKYRSPKGGDNLFLSSIVALKPDSGEYVWHYQETPGDTWDYTATQHIMVADLQIDGQMRHVVMQAPKNGFFYILDAATGKLISANPFAKQTWTTGVDMATGRPIETPGARYNETSKPFNMLPGPAGAHAWQPMAFSHQTGLVYIPATDHWSVMTSAENFTPIRGRPNTGLGGPASTQQFYAENPNAQRGFISRLMAFNPVTGKEAWTTANFPAGTGGIQLTGGALATAGGLVFHGNLPNREFVAYRATDGEPLWKYDIKTGVFNAAISYELDGTQYVALAVGGPGQGGYYAPNAARMLVFALGGTKTLPDLPPYQQPGFVQAKQFAPAQVVERGGELFASNCAMCHGQGGAARATFPDLRRSTMIVNQAAFDTVVLQGALATRGMGSFADRLRPADTEAVRAYLIGQADAASKAPPNANPFGAAPAAAVPLNAPSR